MFGDWVLAKIGYPQNWGPWYSAIGLMEGDEIVAGAVYTDYDPGVTMTMHVAAEGKQWASRAFGRAVFGFPFVQCKVRRVSAYIATRNSACIRFVEKLGFINEGKMQHALPNDDVLIYGLLRENVRWL